MVESAKQLLVNDEELKREHQAEVDDSSPVQKKNPRTRFTERILKQVIGQERANAAL